MLRRTIPPFALAGALLATPCMAQTTPPNVVSIEWVSPERYSDLGDGKANNDKLRKAYIADLQQHTLEYATKVLNNFYQLGGYQLKISISDVDMAGEYEPGKPAVRAMRDIYPPRIKLNFRLTEADGTVINEGPRTLQDLLYQTRQVDRKDPLRYEKVLIDSWLDRDLKRQG